MRIHYLQHVSFENPGYISLWAKAEGFELAKTLLHRGYSLPALSQFDRLIILGGPMNVYEEKLYPWLKAEKKLIEKAIAADKKVLGICLGAQLIATVLGADVYPNRHQEIGWFPIQVTAVAGESNLSQVLPQTFDAFHWHGDTFDLPSGAFHIAASECCKNQAFSYNHDRVIGLQFHLETTVAGAMKLIKHGADVLNRGPFIQSPKVIMAERNRFSSLNQIMNAVLNWLYHG